MSRTNETRFIEWHEPCRFWRKMFVIINNVGIKINADVNVRNYLIKKCVMKDLFGILVIVSVNVGKHVMLANI